MLFDELSIVCGFGLDLILFVLIGVKICLIIL